MSPLPLAVHSLGAAPATGDFSFVAGGDNRSTAHGEPMPPSTEEIFREIGLIRPDLVIWTGDSIEGYDDTAADADAEYKTFLSAASLANTPFFNAPGNHEISFDPALQGVYTRDMGALYGSFDYSGSHFIALDSSPIVGGKIRDGYIDPDQMRWLVSDLEANRRAANIFVFFHHYMFGPVDPDMPAGSPRTGFQDEGDRDALHQLFVKYHVRAVFNGHSHVNWHKTIDGVNYFIAGNAGAPLDAPPEEGGYLGYLLVQVHGDDIATHELTPWSLLTRTVSGNDGVAATARIAVSSYAYPNLETRGLWVLMPKAASYTVRAVTRYKGKSPAANAAVDHIEAAPVAGQARVYLSTPLKHARTTYITVTAVE